MLFLQLPKVAQVLLIAAALAQAEGCGSGGPGSGDERPVRRPLVGYGVTRHWHTLDAEAFADLLARNNLGLTGIEWNPLVKSCARGGTDRDVFLDPHRGAAFVNAMRSRGITTLINVVNWHGCFDQRQSDAWFEDRLREIIAFVGPDRVILSPVAEPWHGDRAKAHRWIRRARTQWTGPFAIAARTGHGNTDPVLPGVIYDFVDAHPCSDDEAIAAMRPRVLVNTDCSPVMDPGPDRAARLTRASLSRGVPLHIYGWFDTIAPNVATIEAMGMEIKLSQEVR